MTVKLGGAAAYTELRVVQPWVDSREGSYPPFFLRQGSHALDRFGADVDMVVTIKGFLRLRTSRLGGLCTRTALMPPTPLLRAVLFSSIH